MKTFRVTTDSGLDRDLNYHESGRFVWGRFITLHTIGEYQFVEYAERGADNHPIYPRKETGRTLFSAYINEKSIHRSFTTLDEALVGVIAYKHDGPNSRAARYFMKMIAQDEEQD